MKELKRDRFVRVAEARTNKILKQIRLIGNLSRKNIYEYSALDVEKIFNAIESEINDAKERFNNAEKGNKTFSLSDPEDSAESPTDKE